MKPLDDWHLLDDFAATGSHAAFEELVNRHAGWIYSGARRRVGTPDVADDVTQATFIVLARKAKSINRKHTLAAWLYRVSRYASLDARRRQTARRRHERAAAKTEVISPTVIESEAIHEHLDAAMDRLSERDREAIILRYFRDQTLEQIGRTQQVAASTVQRRIERSLAQLGYQLKRSGVGIAPSIVAATFAAIGASTAPSSATAGITALAAASISLPTSGDGAIGLAKGTIKTMTLIKLKVAAAIAIAAASVAGAGGVAIVLAETPTVALSPTPTPAQPFPALAAATAPADLDYNRQFVADWQSVQLNVTHVNAAVVRNGQKDSQGVTIMAALNVGEAATLIGFDRMTQLKIVRVLDDAGHDLTAMASKEVNSNRWYEPRPYNPQYDQRNGSWTNILQPLQFTVALDADPRLPKRLSRIDGYLHVLICDRLEYVDVPFVENGAFVDIIPGVRLRFTRAQRSGNGYSYELANELGNKRVFDGRVSDAQPLPQRMIAAAEMVDPAGKVIETTLSFGNFPSGAGSGSGGTSTAQQIAAMRFDVAVGLREQRLSISLKDIDIPVLDVAHNVLPAAVQTPP